jgi:protease-4
MNESNPSRPPVDATSVDGVMSDFAIAVLREQRRARRWNIFFKILLAVYLLPLLVLVLPGLWSASIFSREEVTALVDVQGIIAHGREASADNVVTGLRAAFENANTAGVIIRINSPGGSPVQAGYINDEIYRLKEKYPDIPVYAVIEDICASGGYYVASAADEIYANKASVVGSIGVRLDSFGFVDALEKLGVERRLLTAGQHKGFLDPFLPLDNAEVKHVEGLLADVHEQFKNAVLKGRRDKIDESGDLFSGLMWTGEQGLTNGLVDELGSSGYVAREVIGAKEIVDFTKRKDIFDRFAKRIGASIGDVFFETLGNLR